MKKTLKKLNVLLPYVIALMAVIFISLYVYFSWAEHRNINDTIWSGVVSGIITSFIIFAFHVVWKRNVLKWVEDLMYQDVCIEGEWSGFLIPYMGLDELDEIQKEMAWEEFKAKIKKENESEPSKENDIVEEAVIVDEETTKPNREITAEIVVHKPIDEKEKEKNKTSSNSSESTSTKKTPITIGAQPIIIRCEMKRSGHAINGRIIEIGGASKTHSYNIVGTFKSLILSGTYETFSKDHLDRGAFSLMLLENGNKLEGFFSVYHDGKHIIAPMRCILKKRPIKNSSISAN